ncbi:hypothetical protein LCGC14_2378390 [marine sediment metagenome]|uniref:Uncharacterized protein n=1 Tax=marine sediment metagenome TaxID=412755 RepID=A0A0F9C1T3_9ZZZZ
MYSNDPKSDFPEIKFNTITLKSTITTEHILSNQEDVELTQRSFKNALEVLRQYGSAETSYEVVYCEESKKSRKRTKRS